MDAPLRLATASFSASISASGSTSEEERGKISHISGGDWFAIARNAAGCLSVSYLSWLPLKHR
jgi:hypothetical protein